jgi:hypothetical protein
MKLIGGPREGAEVTIKEPDGNQPNLPHGSILHYRFGPVINGQMQVQMELALPGSAYSPSIPGQTETYVLHEDGWHYV